MTFLLSGNHRRIIGTRSLRNRTPSCGFNLISSRILLAMDVAGCVATQGLERTCFSAKLWRK